MNMKVDLCGVTLNNPVMTASGTFGSGAEYAEFVDLNKLGAVVTKGVAKCSLAGKSDAACRRSIWRHVKMQSDFRIQESTFLWNVTFRFKAV